MIPSFSRYSLDQKHPVRVVMPKYRLTYFHDEGRAEATRQLLEIAGADWEDVRITPAQWKDMQAKTPFGQLPILEVMDKGFSLSQSNAINRYLATQLGLAGKTTEDAAIADMILECITDFVHVMEGVFYETKDAERRKMLLDKFTNEQRDKILTDFDRMLQANGGQYFVGEGISVADIVFTEVVRWTDILGSPPDWDHFPRLKAVTDRVTSHPAVVAWVKRRPASVEWWKE